MSGLIGFHKSWGSYWVNNRLQGPYIKGRSEPNEGKNILRLYSQKVELLSRERLTLPSEGVWPVNPGPLLIAFSLL